MQVLRITANGRLFRWGGCSWQFQPSTLVGLASVQQACLQTDAAFVGGPSCRMLEQMPLTHGQTADRQRQLAASVRFLGGGGGRPSSARAWRFVVCVTA